jgi:hypothetical protein
MRLVSWSRNKNALNKYQNVEKKQFVQQELQILSNPKNTR